MNKCYKYDLIFSYAFVKDSETRFIIVVMYVNDMNLISISEELGITAEHLMKEFEVKKLEKTKLCLGAKIGHIEWNTFPLVFLNRKTT